MATAVKKTLSGSAEQKKRKPVSEKSKIALFWEKYPEGIITVYDRRAVNK